jgi:Cdc6-like AAA superfamily ATPase
MSKIEANVETMTYKLNNNEDMKVLSWLPSIGYDPQQSYFSNREPGTGQWLLNSEQYQNWLKADNQTLFCPGIPGAGKTFITSIVIDYLQTTYKSSSIAYLYCYIRNQG